MFLWHWNFEVGCHPLAPGETLYVWSPSQLFLFFLCALGPEIMEFINIHWMYTVIINSILAYCSGKQRQLQVWSYLFKVSCMCLLFVLVQISVQITVLVGKFYLRQHTESIEPVTCMCVWVCVFVCVCMYVCLCVCVCVYTVSYTHLTLPTRRTV